MRRTQGPSSSLKNLINNTGKTNNKKRKFHYIVLVLGFGAIFMLAGNSFFKPNPSTSAFTTPKKQPSDSKDVPPFGVINNFGNSSISDYQQLYETELKTAIEGMLGVKNVQVVVNLDSSEQQEFETNKTTQTQTTEETDKSGAHQKVQNSSTNEQIAITNNGTNQAPIVVETKKPEIRGVLVVVKGAENIKIKTSIVEAVTRVLGVNSSLVAVEPQK